MLCCGELNCNTKHSGRVGYDPLIIGYTLKTIGFVIGAMGTGHPDGSSAVCEVILLSDPFWGLGTAVPSSHYTYIYIYIYIYLFVCLFIDLFLDLLLFIYLFVLFVFIYIYLVIYTYICIYLNACFTTLRECLESKASGLGLSLSMASEVHKCSTSRHACLYIQATRVVSEW